MGWKFIGISENLNKKDQSHGWKVAIMYANKIYCGKPSEIHSSIIERIGLKDYQNIKPGFLSPSGKWHYQFESDYNEKIRHRNV